MQRFRQVAGIVAALLALSLVAAACSGDTEHRRRRGRLGGEGLTGRDQDLGLVDRPADLDRRGASCFNATNPDVEIRVDGPGTGDGFELFCDGEIDISDASRPIERKTRSRPVRRTGIEYIELEVAVDGVTVMTNPANTASSA